MPRVFIPPNLRDLTGGVASVEVAGSRVDAVVVALDRLYPGVRDRLCEGDELRSGMTVVVDSDVAPLGLLAKVEAGSEVHFLPAIGGGHQ